MHMQLHNKILVYTFQTLQKDNMIDPFVIYGDQYSINRNSLVVLHEEKAIASFKTLEVCML